MSAGAFDIAMKWLLVALVLAAIVLGIGLLRSRGTAAATVAPPNPAPPSAIPPTTRLYDAAVAGDTDLVRRVLADDPASVNTGDAWGFTALHGVVGEEHHDIAALLIASGADVNARNDDGVTPLHLVAWPDMAERLLDHGADIEARTRQGQTPLHAAVEHPELVDIVEVLLLRGADPHAEDRRGTTPLQVAEALGEQDKVALLRQHGAQR